MLREDGWRWLHAQLLAVNRLGKINCLLSDGVRLFCYHDQAGWKGLTFRKVYIHDREARHFEAPTVQINLEGQAFNHGFVAVTPMTGQLVPASGPS